ncbi:MAG: nucleotidyl transferase AbiEii/AbiGii toxin family protein [Pseudomonadota bacterium]|nr:nucleotidyl transferase AbiEii/AbiGii toxin family protein [Pseudomonadota bacterium]
MKYKTPYDLRQAIAHHLRMLSKGQGISVERLRRHLAFERLLARLFKEPKPAWVLKGGYAMELRTQNARVTKDVDLTIPEGSNIPTEQSKISVALYDSLTNALAEDLGDFFSFSVREKSVELVGPPNGGVRFHVSAILDGRIFAEFHVDIGTGDVRIWPFEKLACRNLLAFAGVDCPAFPSIPAEQQFAEKLHAHTFQQDGKSSSRVKDLTDMVLLIQGGEMDRSKLLSVLQQTFAKRNTHPLPDELPLFSDEWAEQFATLATKCRLEMTLMDASLLVKNYFKKIVSGVAP